MTVEAVKALITKLIESREQEIVQLKEFLEALNETPEEIIEAKEWDPNKIKWVEAEGFSGPYQRYPAKGAKVELTADYKAMLADLKAHDGKLTRDGYFYWLFNDGATVGRKKRLG